MKGTITDRNGLTHKPNRATKVLPFEAEGQRTLVKSWEIDYTGDETVLDEKESDFEHEDKNAIVFLHKLRERAAQHDDSIA